MAGFLDNKTRVVDMVLTDYGRELYSQGKLNLEYYAFSDDEVDYDPPMRQDDQYFSGSISATELSSSKVQQIEATLVREAVTGLPDASNSSADDKTNIQDLLFTMPQGQKILPELAQIPEFYTASIDTKQQTIQDKNVTYDQFGRVVESVGPFIRGYRKFETSRLIIDLDVNDFFDKGTREGYLVRAYSSGSGQGLTEISSKRDLANVLSYRGDLQMYRDGEIEKKVSADAGAAEASSDAVEKK